MVDWAQLLRAGVREPAQRVYDVLRSGLSTSNMYEVATLSTNKSEILCENWVMKKSIFKAMRLIEAVIPGMKVVRTYQRCWLWVDLFAWVTIFAMLVPQAIAYGGLAGIAPVVGHYTAIGVLVGYALFGSSRRLMLGPESSSTLLAAAAVAPVAAAINLIKVRNCLKKDQS